MVLLELDARLDNLLSTSQEETADIDIFAPIPDREECPICMIPLPIIEGKTFFSCCGKMICDGCNHKSVMTEKKKGIRIEEQKCAFCQRTLESTFKNEIKLLKRLTKKNNPHALMSMANAYRSGAEVFQSDTRALEMYICAAELGHPTAYSKVGSYYYQGIAVEQDMSKALEFWEVAAKKGCIRAHQVLAEMQNRNGNVDEGIKHFKVAASAGYQLAMDRLMKAYRDEELSKEDLTQILHAFQASCIKMKSEDRDDALVAKARFDEAEQTVSN